MQVPSMHAHPWTHVVMQGSPLHPQAAGRGATMSERAKARAETTRMRMEASRPTPDETHPTPEAEPGATFLHYQRQRDGWIVRRGEKGRVVAILRGTEDFTFRDYRELLAEVEEFVFPSARPAA